MSIVFSIRKFHVCGWWSRNFKVKNYRRHFRVRCIHTWHMHALCIYLCNGWEHIQGPKLASRTLTVQWYWWCHVRTLLECLSVCATLEVHVPCAVYWNRDCAVCLWSILAFVANCWLVHTGRGSASRCLTRRSVLSVHEGWSFLFCCSMLAESPSNGSMMAQQMTLLGTVVEKGQFFKGLSSADDNAGY